MEIKEPFAAPLGQAWSEVQDENGSTMGHYLRPMGTRPDGLNYGHPSEISYDNLVPHHYFAAGQPPQPNGNLWGPHSPMTGDQLGASGYIDPSWRNKLQEVGKTNMPSVPVPMPGDQALQNSQNWSFLGGAAKVGPAPWTNPYPPASSPQSHAQVGDYSMPWPPDRPRREITPWQGSPYLFWENGWGYQSNNGSNGFGSKG